MKFFIASFAAVIALGSSQSQAFVGQRAKYNCSGSKGSVVSIVLDTAKPNLIVIGKFKGEGFNFSNKSTFENGYSTFVDQPSGLTVKVQEAGPYDGGQDALGGSISKGSETENLTCYIGMDNQY